MLASNLVMRAAHYRPDESSFPFPADHITVFPSPLTTSPQHGGCLGPRETFPPCSFLPHPASPQRALGAGYSRAGLAGSRFPIFLWF